MSYWSEPEQVGVSGLVVKVEKPKKVRGVWAPSEFTVLALKCGIEFECKCSGFCRVVPEDMIQVQGMLKKEIEKDDEKETERVLRYCIEVKVQPIVEPGTSKQAIIQVFNLALPRRGKLTSTIGPKIYKSLTELLKNTADPAYKDLDMPDRVNFYMVHVSNLLAEAGAELDEDLIEPLMEHLEKADALRLIRYWYNNREMRKLQMLGLSNAEIKESGMSTQKLFDKIRKNPYTVPCISLSKCEALMMRFRKPISSEQVRRGEILRHVYTKTHKYGWSCVPIGMLLQSFPDLYDHLEALCAEEDPEENTMDGYGICKYKTSPRDVYVYLRDVFEVETELVERIEKLCKDFEAEAPEPFDPVFHCQTLSDDQQIAISGAMNSPISVITGGGGCGKTTSIVEIVKNFDLHNIRYAITSFTGKAVSRVREVLSQHGFSQTRIDKLTYTLHRGVYLASEDEDDLTHLIVDEASMVTSDILVKFLRRNKTIQSIVLVGDCNQLLPIGWGCLFSEIIASNCFPVYKLNVNHRVANNGGGIKLNAENMRNTKTKFSFEGRTDYVLKTGDTHEVVAQAKKFIDDGVKDYQITVVTPFNKSRGVLNHQLQSLFRWTPEEELKRNGEDARSGRRIVRSCADSFKRRWCLGDRCIMLENNYDINVYNGEEGRVIKIDPVGKRVQISFTPRSLSEWVDECDINTSEFNFLKERSSWFSCLIPKDDAFGGDRNEKRRGDGDLHLGMVDHAYTLTVHKAQGSEWENVIFYVPSYARPSKSFLNRNLTYTGTTRSKLNQVTIGDLGMMEMAANTRAAYRCENTKTRLQLLLPQMTTDEMAYEYGDDDFDVFEEGEYWDESDF